MDARARAAPERVLRWDGCVNVRDLGGLPLADGGETAYRVVVRADWLPGLSEDGRQALLDYGISLIVDLRPEREHEDDGTITGFREAPLLEHWVNSGVYVLGEDAVALLPEKGDHEQSTFPQLAAERQLHAHRHDGVWLTVNTPKDLRRAAEFMEAHPDWKPQRQAA